MSATTMPRPPTILADVQPYYRCPAGHEYPQSWGPDCLTCAAVERLEWLECEWLRLDAGPSAPRPTGPLPDEDAPYYTTDEGLSVPACMGPADEGLSVPACLSGHLPREAYEEGGGAAVPAWVLPLATGFALGLLVAALIVRGMFYGLPG